MNDPCSPENYHRSTPEERAAWWRRYNGNVRKRPAFAIGGRVLTDYVPKEKKVPRVVRDVYPASTACQTGWHVKTECGLDLDSGWFTRYDEQHLLF